MPVVQQLLSMALTGVPHPPKFLGYRLDGSIELLNSDDPILDETLSETSEDETMPEVYEIAGSGLEGTANLLLNLC